MIAHASPQGQWQGSDLEKDCTTAKELRGRESARPNNRRRQAGLSIPLATRQEIWRQDRQQCSPTVPQHADKPPAVQQGPHLLRERLSKTGLSERHLHGPLLPNMEESLPHRFNPILSLYDQYCFNKVFIHE